MLYIPRSASVAPRRAGHSPTGVPDLVPNAYGDQTDPLMRITPSEKLDGPLVGCRLGAHKLAFAGVLGLMGWSCPSATP
jgi:hypothetical protein